MFKNSRDCAERVLLALFRHRRLAMRCGAAPCAACLAPHLGRVERAIENGRPLELVLPAFPAKSPSPKKTLGPLPDRAEALALRHLQRVCDALTEVHPAGVRVHLCSDGRVFSDLVGVTDDTVTRYGRALAREIERAHLESLSLWSMEDFLGDRGFDAMRAELCARFAEPLVDVERSVHVDPARRALWNGLQRFLFEDRAALEPALTRTKLRALCKGRAYLLLQRSAAWGRLLAHRFPDALRLSIHPQGPHADKIGVRLADEDEHWLTPWHAVAVEEAGRFRLMHRADAEALGARLVIEEGRASHYQLARAAA